MTVTITITDPTADESRAVRAYLDALHGGTAAVPVPVQHTERAGAVEVRQTVHEAEEPVTAEDAGAPDFDSAGLPWDKRIHASSRATVADGTWRKKRGVSDELVAEVEQELQANALAQDGHTAEAEALLDTSEPTKTLEVPEAPVGESTPAPTPDVPSPEPAEPVAVSAPTPDDAPPPPPAATPNPFLAVMSRIGKSKLDKAKKDELLTAAGALDDKGNPSILVLNKRPELIDGFVALLDSEGV